MSEGGKGNGNGPSDEESPGIGSFTFHNVILKQLSQDLRRQHEHNVKLMTLVHDMREELELGRQTQTMMLAELEHGRHVNEQTRHLNSRMLMVLERIAGNTERTNGD